MYKGAYKKLKLTSIKLFSMFEDLPASQTNNHQDREEVTMRSNGSLGFERVTSLPASLLAS